MRREARRSFRAGVNARRAANEIPLGPYAAWVKAERVQSTVAKLYQEFRGQRGQRLSRRVAGGE